jgi:hypothetical protein
MNTLQIYEGIVEPNSDNNAMESGSLQVKYAEGVATVHYCSPYGGFDYGFVGIPLAGTKVAFARTNKGNYVLLGAIFTTEWHEKEVGGEKDFIATPTLPDKAEIFKWSGFPGKSVWKDPNNNKIWLNHQTVNTEDEGEKQDRGILLRTELEKHIHINDTKDAEYIILGDRANNEVDDKVNWIGIIKDAEGLDDDSIVAFATNKITLTGRGVGDIKIVVKANHFDVDIIIENEGAGNINIIAAQGDINLTAEQSNINLTAAKDIILDAGGEVGIHAGSAITETAGGTISQSAGASFTQSSGGAMSLSSAAGSWSAAGLSLGSPVAML